VITTSCSARLVETQNGKTGREIKLKDKQKQKIRQTTGNRIYESWLKLIARQ